MIVCKIIADYDSPNGDFSGFFDALSPLGAVLCVDDAIFFASSVDGVDKKKVKRILRKHGYEDSVITEYGVDNPPRESEMVNGWVFDFLSQHAVLRLTRENREKISESIRRLDEIDRKITEELSKLPQKPNERDETEVDNG